MGVRPPAPGTHPSVRADAFAVPPELADPSPFGLEGDPPRLPALRNATAESSAVPFFFFASAGENSGVSGESESPGGDRL